MTWSIIARDETTGRIGIAVATRFFAVGARVPHIRTGAGALATQALTNPYWGSRGLALLTAGASAEETVRMLRAADDGREHRQAHVMDKQGRFAAATGSSCIDWCGHLVRDTFSIAGNMLAGAAVLDETAKVYEAGEGQPFARRLIAALVAGEAAGGDKRGKQSAALLIHDAQEHAALDIRVDDHTDPLAELARLEVVSRERFVHARRYGPMQDDQVGIIDRAALDLAVQKSIAEGYE
jgi:uncharacterized Ntn-hydrolase superfamily protein